MKTALTLALAAALLAGCGGDTDEPAATETTTQEQPADTETAAYSDECGSAVEEAANIPAGEDTVEDLDPAIVACADLDAFAAATSDYPDALDGTDPETFVSNRCQYSEDSNLTGSAICSEVAE